MTAKEVKRRKDTAVTYLLYKASVCFLPNSAFIHSHAPSTNIYTENTLYNMIQLV